MLSQLTEEKTIAVENSSSFSFDGKLINPDYVTNIPIKNEKAFFGSFMQTGTKNSNNYMINS